MEKKYLSARDVMNYCFCPRIVYYEHVLKIPQITTRKEFKGRDKYDDFKQKSKRNKIVKEFPTKLRKVFDITLKSENLGLITKTDCILFDDRKKEAYPISIKYAKRPNAIYRTMKNQLLLEAVLIEEQLGYKVNYGFIKFMLSGGTVKVWLDKKEQFLSLLQSIKTIATKEILPQKTKYPKCCTDCCYRKLCWVN